MHKFVQIILSYFLNIVFIYMMLKVVQLLNVFTPERNLDDFQTLYVGKLFFFHRDVYPLFCYTDTLY
jgi:hypothetical protein